MAAYTIYLDQVFLGNMALNYIILWAAAKLSKAPLRKYRLGAAALLGASYSLAALFPGYGYLTAVWCKAAVSVALIAAAFYPLSVRQFLSCLGCFYLASFTLGGMIFGMVFFINSSEAVFVERAGTVIGSYFWPGLFLGLTVFWLAAKGFGALVKSGSLDYLYNLPLSIEFEGRKVMLKAFLDTGNRLRDPLSQRPVIIAQYSVVKPLLPLEVQRGFEEEGEPCVWHALETINRKQYSLRFSAIPFRTIGQTNGLLLGFRPDGVVVEKNGRRLTADHVVVAVCRKDLDVNGSFQALIGPELITDAA